VKVRRVVRSAVKEKPVRVRRVVRRGVSGPERGLSSLFSTEGLAEEPRRWSFSLLGAGGCLYFRWVNVDDRVATFALMTNEALGCSSRTPIKK
jgi:hypothetical protein